MYGLTSCKGHHQLRQSMRLPLSVGWYVATLPRFKEYVLALCLCSTPSGFQTEIQNHCRPVLIVRHNDVPRGWFLLCTASSHIAGLYGSWYRHVIQLDGGDYSPPRNVLCFYLINITISWIRLSSSWTHRQCIGEIYSTSMRMSINRADPTW